MPVSIQPFNAAPAKTESCQVPFFMEKYSALWTPKADTTATSATVLSGAAMVSKNRIIAWPSLILALYTYVNSKPLRTSEGAIGGGGLQGLGIALISLLTVYIPTFLMLPEDAPISSHAG